MNSRVDWMCLVAGTSESFRKESEEYYKASVRVRPQGFFCFSNTLRRGFHLRYEGIDEVASPVSFTVGTTVLPSFAPRADRESGRDIVLACPISQPQSGVSTDAGNGLRGVMGTGRRGDGAVQYWVKQRLNLQGFARCRAWWGLIFSGWGL